ncbi:sulfatase-like hydrolase/transferase [Candidatus Binatia bacterium]|jgi:arylsulfatase A-like enzyme|nr:sulfatase-like hydrolase/transferase [Candidatus Binatia bacterium]
MPRHGTRALLLLLAAALAAACSDAPTSGTAPAARPNFLWIVADDMSFELAAYGDPLARTPNLDRLAAEGVRYTNAFATAGVCAPSRATLITGMYATSIGAHHMRSIVGGYYPVPPPEVKTFTEYLRAAGYYASSKNKLDYQFSDTLTGAPITNWDDANGDWHGRAPDQPFFAYVTLLETHESQLLVDGPIETDPGAVNLPPYLPDTPVVRGDLARFYDNVARLDAQVGRLLDMLDEEGLAENTIVFFFPDNGRPLPREKRWVYDGGIHEPVIVRWPGTLDPGGVNERLVSYVDFAPTVLSLAGVEVPSHMQGRVFLGAHVDPEPDFVFAAADRFDEAEDRIRAVRDTRFKYVRNYHPETPYGQTIRFRDNLKTMQEIFRMHDAGLLLPPADWYYRATKPIEELYDTASDPYELDDLADRPEQQQRLARMRAAHEQWVQDTGDLGAIPEEELAEQYWPGGVQPVAPPPSIEPAGGASDGPVQVAIRSEVEGASLAYTLEAGDDAHWLLYMRPITLDASATLRARAVRYGWADSSDASATFTVGGR